MNVCNNAGRLDWSNIDGNKKKMVFNYSIQTDGVAVCLSYKTAASVIDPKRKVKKPPSKRKKSAKKTTGGAKKRAKKELDGKGMGEQDEEAHHGSGDGNGSDGERGDDEQTEDLTWSRTLTSMIENQPTLT